MTFFFKVDFNLVCFTRFYHYCSTCCKQKWFPQIHTSLCALHKLCTGFPWLACLNMFHIVDESNTARTNISDEMALKNSIPNPCSRSILRSGELIAAHKAGPSSLPWPFLCEKKHLNLSTYHHWSKSLNLQKLCEYNVAFLQLFQLSILLLLLEFHRSSS